jgi:hypothetical protein
MEGFIMEKEYNGWKNRQTWNVALWINNDEGLYNAAVDFMKTYKGKRTYRAFIKHEGLTDQRTPDNISFSGTRLDYKELNNMMLDLIN